MPLPPTPEPPADPPAERRAEPAAPGTASSQGTLVQDDRPLALEAGAPSRLAWRGLLLAMSAAGVVGALLLWAFGHSALAARLLAGDVLLMFIVLMAL